MKCLGATGDLGRVGMVQMLREHLGRVDFRRQFLERRERAKRLGLARWELECERFVGHASGFSSFE